MNLFPRLRAVVRRSAHAAPVVMRAATKVGPHRCLGAVQEPPTAWADATQVMGWAAFPRDEVLGVFVTVDGGHATRAAIGPPTRDVVTARRWSRRAGIPCGWTATVDLASFRDRTVSIGGFAVSRRGLTHRLADLRVTVGAPRSGAIDFPEPGKPVRGHVRVAGWALPTDRPLERIEVRVDGDPVGLARPFAFRRNDIAEIRDAPSAPVAGFEHFVRIDGEPGTPIRIEVDVVDLDGTRTELPPVDVLTDRDDGAADSSNGQRASAVVQERVAPVRATQRGPIRIVAFTHQLDIGGGQLFLHELLLSLRHHDQAEIAVVAERDGALRAELEALGIPVTVTTFPVKTLDAYERKVAELEQLVLAHGADVVIVNTMHVGIGGDVARRLGIPAVWAVHESFTIDDFFFAAYGANAVDADVRALMLDALASSAVVTFEADATRRAYAEEIDNPNLLTVHYGIDIDRIDKHRRTADPRQLRHELGISTTATVLLCPATYEPRKAPVLLVTAFAEVAAEYPTAVLVLLGDTRTDYAKGVRKVVDRLDLNDQIRLEPMVLDPMPWYSVADAVVLASDVESLPRVLLEAMAFGLPVAATEIWGVPEAVEDGVSGVLFPARDVSAAIRALRRVLAMSSDERAAFGAAGSLVVRRDFGMGYVDTYRRLLHGLASDPTAEPHALLQS